MVTQNILLLSATIISVILAQVIDLIISSIKSKKLILNRLWQTGGFPSSHSAGVASLATGIFLIQGLSIPFIISLSFAAVVVRDAIGVRQEVGNQSKYLNKKFKTRFNEKTGHSIKEVIGGIILGVLISLIVL